MFRIASLKDLVAHPADRTNVALALISPALVFAPFFLFRDRAFVAQIYGIMLFLYLGKVNYILHLHIHRPLCKTRWLNKTVESFLGVSTAMVASNWRIQHLYGHHRGIDEKYRGDRSWQLQKFTVLRALSYPLLSMGPTLWEPYKESFEKGILQNVTTPMNYRWAFAEQTGLIILLATLYVANPRLTLLYLIPWYFFTHFITHYVDYLNHYGCDDHETNPYGQANNSTSQSFNASTHNFGYHMAHHLRPSAHWTELPHLHREIADRIPARQMKPFSWSGILLPYHLYLSLFGRM